MFDSVVGDTWKDINTIMFDDSTSQKDGADANSRYPKLSQVPPIRSITQTPRKQCPRGLQRMFDLHNTKSSREFSVKKKGGNSKTAIVEGTKEVIDDIDQRSRRRRSIPPIVHQSSGGILTAKSESHSSRCLSDMYISSCYKWILSKWSYYFHDVNAISKLLLHSQGIDSYYYPEFPYLRNVVKYCILGTTTTSPRHGDDNDDYNPLTYLSIVEQQLILALWKYIVLWMYGGVYADINVSMFIKNTKGSNNKKKGGIGDHLSNPFHHTHANNDGQYTKLKSILMEETQGEEDEESSHGHANVDGIVLYNPDTKSIRLDFFAVTPRHPLMFLCIQHLIVSILKFQRTRAMVRTQKGGQQQSYTYYGGYNSFNNNKNYYNITAEYENVNQLIQTSFETAFDEFRRIQSSPSSSSSSSTNKKNYPKQPFRRDNTGGSSTGTILYGPSNYTLRVLGYGEPSNTYLTYVIPPKHTKLKQDEYSKMNLNTLQSTIESRYKIGTTHGDGKADGGDGVGKTCFRVMLDQRQHVS